MARPDPRHGGATQRAIVRINQVQSRACCECCGSHGNVHYRKAFDMDMCNRCYGETLDAGRKKD